MPPKIYKHYLLLILTVLVISNCIDRVALGILLEDIKADLQLSDTQLGFLTGIAFALFYSVMGIPIARWADRGNRVTIIGVTTALWSLAVALCGMAGSFFQLLLIRVGVAVGEAGCHPPAFSLMADYFTRAERPRATAIYGLGGAFGTLIGFFLAGWLNEFYGWRTTFVLLGLPGLLLALISWVSLREPRRGVDATETACEIPTPAQPDLKEVFATLWGNSTFRRLLLCLSLMFFFNYGVLQWQPAFFIRSYGLTTGEIGTWFALIYGLSGIVGCYLSGEWAVRYAKNNERLQLRVMSIGIGCAGLLSVFVYLAPNHYMAFALMACFGLGASALNGPLFATIQTLVPGHMRAVSFALVYLFANLIGMGFGPLTVGIVSDLLRSSVGEESLRYALALLAPGYLLAAWKAWQASRTVMRDLAVAEARGSIGREVGSSDQEFGEGARTAENIGLRTGA